MPAWYMPAEVTGEIYDLQRRVRALETYGSVMRNITGARDLVQQGNFGNRTGTYAVIPHHTVQFTLDSPAFILILGSMSLLTIAGGTSNYTFVLLSYNQGAAPTQAVAKQSDAQIVAERAAATGQITPVHEGTLFITDLVSPPAVGTVYSACFQFVQDTGNSSGGEATTPQLDVFKLG